MKHIVVAVILLCGIASQAQILTPVHPTTYGSHSNREKIDSALMVPEKAGLTIDSYDSTAQIFYYKVDSSIYLYSRYTGFKKIAGSSSPGGGDMSFTDTSAMLHAYLSAIINLQATKMAFTDSAAMLQAYRLRDIAITASILLKLDKNDSTVVTGFTSRGAHKKSIDSLAALITASAYTNEQAQDAVFNAITASVGIIGVYNDGANTYSLKADTALTGLTSWLLTKKKVDSLGVLITAAGTSPGLSFVNSVRLTVTSVDLVNDSAILVLPKMYGALSGVKGWYTTPLYAPTDPQPGQHIVLAPDAVTWINADGLGSFQDHVIVGCDVIQTGPLTVTVNTPCSYTIGNNEYHLSAPTPVTIPDGTADPGEFREDAIVVNTSSTATSVLGDNSVGGVGAAAQPGENQLLITYLRVDEENAFLTLPSNLKVLHDEGYGSGEWFMSRNATIDSVYTGVTAYSPTHSIRVTAASNNQWFQINSPFGEILHKQDYTTFSFWAYNVSNFNNNRNWFATLRLNGNQVSTSVAINIAERGYLKNTTGQWMLVSITMADFHGSDNFNGIRLTNTGTGGTVNVLFDYFTLQSMIQIINQTDNVNIYNSDGTLNGDRTVDLNHHYINFMNSDAFFVKDYNQRNLIQLSTQLTLLSSTVDDGNFLWQNQVGTRALNPYNVSLLASKTDDITSDIFISSIIVHPDSIHISNSQGIYYLDQPIDGTGFDMQLVWNSSTRQMGIVAAGGGGGVGGWPLAGSFSLTDDVIGDLDGHLLALGDGGDNGLFLTTGDMAFSFTDGSTHTNLGQNAGNIKLESENEAETITNRLRIDQSGVLVTLADDKVFKVQEGDNFMIFGDGGFSVNRTDGSTFTLINSNSTSASLISSNIAEDVVNRFDVSQDGVLITLATGKKFTVTGLQNFVNNAAAISGGLTAGDFYRNGDVLQIVH